MKQLNQSWHFQHYRIDEEICKAIQNPIIFLYNGAKILLSLKFDIKNQPVLERLGFNQLQISHVMHYAASARNHHHALTTVCLFSSNWLNMKQNYKRTALLSNQMDKN